MCQEGLSRLQVCWGDVAVALTQGELPYRLWGGQSMPRFKAAAWGAYSGTHIKSSGYAGCKADFE